MTDWVIGGPPGPGNYNPTFGSGDIWFQGPYGPATTPGLEYGSILPNPTGTPGPALLLGSGGGGGTAVTFCIIQDQAFDDVTPGNNLIITSGETQGAGTANGGYLLTIGGGSYGGTGGANTVQGGTSLNGPGGMAVLQGGNSTNGIPGDAFVIGGETGTQGANVHLVATELASAPGVVRLRLNSNIMADFIPIGSASAGNQPFAFFVYGGSNSGWGAAGAPLVSGGINGATNWFSGGYSGTITFGTGHSMTVVNGLITGYS